MYKSSCDSISINLQQPTIHCPSTGPLSQLKLPMKTK